MKDIKIFFRRNKNCLFSNQSIPTQSWLELAYFLQKETKLLFCTASELRQRWERGRAVCAMDGERIVSYISFATNYDAQFRHQLSQYTDTDTTLLPEIDVYESTTGWTHSDYRGLGLQSKIHRLLYDSLENNETGISFCVGLAASPIFIKLGWHLIDWEQFPYVTSLGAWFIKSKLYVVRSRSHKDFGVEPYCGPHINNKRDQLHNWERYLHLWVKDVDKIIFLEEKLRSSIGEIESWRAKVMGFHASLLLSIAVAA